MSRYASAGVMLSALWLPAAWVSADTVSLEYRELSAAESARSDSGLGNYRRILVSTARPPGKWRTPTLGSDALYALLDLGSTAPRLMVLDRGDAKTYSRLYYDANGDKVLREQPLEGEVTGSNVVFPALDVKVKASGKVSPYRFRVEVQDLRESAGRFTPEYVYVYLVSSCCYEGTGDINGKKRRIFLADANVNGTFGDRPAKARVMITATSQLSVDRLLMAPVEKKAPEGAGWILGDFLVIEDGVYRVAVSTAQKKLVLSPYTSKTGPVEMPAGLDRLSLCSIKGDTWVMVASPTVETRLPLGRWRMVDYEISRKDEKGSVWYVHARPKPDAAIISVGRKEREIKLGEPFVPTVETQNLGGGNVRLTFKLFGAGLEEASVTIADSTGARRSLPAAPRFKIAATDGELVHQGTFKYG